MAAVKRSPSGEAEFRRVRHLAALKAWDKRGRKKDGIVQRGDAQVDAVLRRRGAAGPSNPGGGDKIKITGNKPPTPIPLEGVGGPGDWRMRGPVQ